MAEKTVDTWVVTSRFYVEAAVASAKSSVFLTTAEDEIKRGEFVSGAISAYYSLFHLSLGLMWLFADKLPPTVLNELTEIRTKGNELPSSDITHKRVEKFLCDGQLKLSNAKSLCALFRRAQELREFANYGPRVTCKGKQPIVGPCNLSTRDVETLVEQIRSEFINTICLAAPKTALDGTLAPLVIDQAIDLMKRSEFPFIAWSSNDVHRRALDLLSNLHGQMTKK